jgi:hypothetical protein
MPGLHIFFTLLLLLFLAPFLSFFPVPFGTSALVLPLLLLLLLEAVAWLSLESDRPRRFFF